MYIIYYISKNLVGAKLNCILIEKEFLTIVYVINKFWHHVAWYSLFVHIYRYAIKYLMCKPTIHSRITRWLLLLQGFNLITLEKPYCKNVVIDFFVLYTRCYKFLTVR
jgi:hypothetical protein